YNEEAAKIKAASTSAFLQVTTCEDNIAKWKDDIREYEDKIAEAKEQIALEEVKKQEFAAQAVEVPRVQIDELAHAGIQHYSDGLAIS
ncbi:hypothetical protein A2U01_0083023, partial [Trifolium medium]|nr:hypothetical protein [Trifolium medium]